MYYTLSYEIGIKKKDNIKISINYANWSKPKGKN